MESRAAQALKLYRPFKSDFLSTEGACLPEAYKKFYREWKEEKPTPVHYCPNPAKYVRNENTGEVTPVQNVPIPVKYPIESNYGIWGGEGVIKGFQKRNRLKARVPHFWVPNLKKSAVYSEILDKTMAVTVTERTIDLILEHKGFDNYLLQTRACDLQSTLALKLKQKMLDALYTKQLYVDNPRKQEEVFNKYKHFLDKFTKEEIDWYGLTIDEALVRHKELEAKKNAPFPLKHKFREELIMKLIEDVKLRQENVKEETSEERSSWLSRFNPFSKPSKS